MILSRQAFPASHQPAPPYSALIRRFRDPDRLLGLDGGRLETVTISGRLVAKGTFAPGWRWSRCARAANGRLDLGTVVALVLGGRFGLRCREWAEVELEAGDLLRASLAAPFDLWVLGERPGELLYLSGVQLMLRELGAPA